MDTMFAFAAILLGFVPFVLTALAIVFVLWAATKLFPEFGDAVARVMDALFGVDEEYDEEYNTGYTTTPRY